MEPTNTRKVIVKLIDGTIVMGSTNIQNHNRLSDALNTDSKPFVTLYDVHISGYEGKVLFINKNQIMWSMPQDEELTPGTDLEL